MDTSDLNYLLYICIQIFFNSADMRKKVYLLLLLFPFALIGCKRDLSKRNAINNKNVSISNANMVMNWNNQLVNDSMIHKLSPHQLLVRFDDKYPVGLDVIDSLLYVIMVRSDTAVYVYNKNTRDLCKSFGYIGRGPQDVLSPNFLKNNYEVKKDESILEFYDLDARKIFKNVDEKIVPTKEFVEGMYPADQLNISGDYWIGRTFQGANNDLFKIYNAKTHEYTCVDLYPVIPDLDEKIDKSRLYSVVLACNRKYNKIVVGMYYFDLILVYDFEGKLLHTFSISDKYQIREAVRNMLNGDEYIGFSQIYATDDYCYLRRCLKGGKGDKKMKGSHFVRMDWNGNIVGIYYMDEYTTADFCVDETTTKIYCISQMIENNEEYYDIVSYKL